jgi:hypothetical protein
MSRSLQGLIASGTIATMAGAGLVAAAPAQAAPTLEGGVQRVCVSGTHGKYARLALLDAHRQVLAIYHVRSGCLTFRVGDNLPPGTYRIKHRAPKGRLTGRVDTSGGFVNPDGSAGSATSRDRGPVHLKKVKSATFEIGPTLFGSVSFNSVRNRHQ